MQASETRGRPLVPLSPILAVNFVGMLGFSIVLPFLVYLVTRWGGNAFVYGLLGATYSAFQLVGAPFLGRWSDAYGRRRILLVSQIGTLASWILFLIAFALPTASMLDVNSTALGTFSLTLPLLAAFVARAADGLTGGNISVATAYLADISNDENRNANFGKLAVSSNLGFVLGPAIAGLLGATPWGEMLPVLAAALISLVAAGLIAFHLPESRPCLMRGVPQQGQVQRTLGGAHQPCFTMKGTSKRSIAQILRMQGIPRLLAIYFLVMLGFNFFYVGFPMHAIQRLSWTVTQTGAYFAVLSALMVIVQGPVLARLSKRISDVTLVPFGGLILVASFALLIRPAAASVYASAVLLALGNGLMWPSIVSVLAKTAGSVYQGAVQGFAASCGAIASIIGMVFGGVLYDVMSAKLFWVSSALIAVVVVLALPRPPSIRDAPSEP